MAEPAVSTLLIMAGVALLAAVLTRRLPKRAGRAARAQRAVVCLVSGDRLLVMQGDGPLELPKGRIKKNERPLTAAHRECFEESGLRPSSLSPLTTLRVQRGKQGRRETWAVFWGPLPDVTVPFEHRVTGKGKDRGRQYHFTLTPVYALDAHTLRPPLGDVLPALRRQLTALQVR